MPIIIKKGVNTDYACFKCGNGTTQQLDSTESDVSLFICPKCMKVVYVKGVR